MGWVVAGMGVAARGGGGDGGGDGGGGDDGGEGGGEGGATEVVDLGLRNIRGL